MNKEFLVTKEIFEEWAKQDIALKCRQNNPPLMFDKNGNIGRIPDRYQEAFVRLRCLEIAMQNKPSPHATWQEIAEEILEWAMQEQVDD